MRRGSTQTVKLEKNGADISSHTATATYKQIEELLGLDHKTFTQIVSQSSASSLEFLTTTDTQRKKFLIDLLDQSHYIVAGEHFKALLKVLDTDIKVQEGKLDVVNSWLTSNQKLDKSLKEIQSVPELDTSIKVKIAELSASVATVVAKNKQITQNNTYKKVLDSIVVPVPVDKPNDTRAEHQRVIAEAKYAEEQQAKIISRFSKLGATCPTCDSHIDTDRIKQIVLAATGTSEAFKIQSAEATKRLAEVNSALTQWNEAASAAEKFETYHSLYDPSLPSELLDAQQLSSEIQALEAEVARQQKAINDITASNLVASKHNSRIEVALEQEEAQKEAQASYLTTLANLKEQKAKLEVLAKTFSTSGLVAYKIECLVKDLEDLTNQYLAELSGGRFQLTFQISGSDKLNVIITDNGLDVEIVELSNGERARVNMAALLGIRKLLQSTSNNEINLLFLDEVIENLDVDGKEKLIEVLLSENTLNTVLVSHGFSHPLLEKIQVLKEDKISRIE
jgi:DNA repair exonuclease SbcCD ATPase subunit